MDKYNNVNRWVIKGQILRKNPGGNNWPLSITLNKGKYGFESDRDNSEISITMRAECQTENNSASDNPECDGFFAFGFGKHQYVVFGTDFDGRLSTGGQVGLQIYPQCGGDVARGNAGNLLNFDTYTPTRDEFLDALSGGDSSNFDLISAPGAANGHNFPITIEITNNDVQGMILFELIHTKSLKIQFLFRDHAV